MGGWRARLPAPRARARHAYAGARSPRVVRSGAARQCARRSRRASFRYQGVVRADVRALLRPLFTSDALPEEQHTARAARAPMLLALVVRPAAVLALAVDQLVEATVLPGFLQERY